MVKFLKGQGSSEYLILLAVVLIVSMVAIALVGGFIDIGSGSLETQSKQYWMGSAKPFSITEYTQQGKTFYLTLKNMEASRLMLNSIYVGESNRSGNVSFNAGATKTVNVTMDKECNSESYDFFEYVVKIAYTTSNGVSKTQIGEKPVAGRCIVVLDD